MKMISETSALVGIAPGAPLMLTDAIGTRVSCTSGAAWITQTHDTRDISLVAGESFVLDRRGTAIVSGSRDTALRLEAAPVRHTRVEGWIERSLRFLRQLSPRFQ
jgi:hypothetical protein